MKSTGLLFILVAVFLFINARNIRDVLQGKVKFSFLETNIGTATKARESGPLPSSTTNAVPGLTSSTQKST